MRRIANAIAGMMQSKQTACELCFEGRHAPFFIAKYQQCLEEHVLYEQNKRCGTTH